MSKVSWKVLLNIPAKYQSTSTTIIFGMKNGTKKFPKSHSETCSGVISVSPLDAPIPNPVIQSRHSRIFLNTSWYGIYPGSQKSRNKMPNGVSDSNVWSRWCASREHELTNWQCVQALMQWYTSLLTIGHQNHASILNKVLLLCMCPTSGYKWHAEITTYINLIGTTLRLSCTTLSISGLV